MSIIASFKSYTTKLWWEYGGEGPLWQKSSYDEVVDNAEGVDRLILYVLNNPVRKGMVDHWEDYHYSGIMHEL
ncbi:MAG: transposase [Armatimonadota bacterium]